MNPIPRPPSPSERGRTWQLLALTIAAATIAAASWAVLRPGETSPKPVEAGVEVEAPPPLAPPKSVYVSPDGSAEADGSQTHPLDLGTALGDGGPVGPGDTVWLRDGIYRGTFSSTVSGERDAPVYVKQYPGERAVLDGAGTLAATLNVTGSDTWFWGLEVTNSDPTREFEEPGDAATRRATAIAVSGSRTRFINMVVHDALNGFVVTAKASDVEIAGCLVYNNGISDPRGAYGYGLLLESAGVTKAVDVVSFGNQGRGIAASTQRRSGGTFLFDGVMSFDNGPSATATSHRTENLFVGTPAAADVKVVVTNSHLYHAGRVTGQNLSLAGPGRANGSVVLSDSVVLGGAVSLSLLNWQESTVKGNLFQTQGSSNPNADQTLVSVRAPGDSPDPYQWDANTYVDQTSHVYAFVFRGATNQYGGGNLSFDEWRRATRFDANSNYSRDGLTGVRVAVRPDTYETGRAHLVVHNWDRKAHVPVSLEKAGLNAGDSFEIVDVRNYGGPSVVSGTYTNDPVELPMRDEFGVFVISRRAPARPAAAPVRSTKTAAGGERPPS
ncbi:MAG: hypothetical protein GEU82_02470 [Luteitalea sp.]|nr:hypothetical protein [Luteitalea sp.]